MDKMLWTLPGMSSQELAFLETLTKDFTEDQNKHFVMIYSTRRKDPQLILLLTLLGFVGLAGVHRMITNEIGLGIVYLFTAGLCLVGTIIDLFNYQQIASNFNRTQAIESCNFVKMYTK